MLNGDAVHIYQIRSHQYYLTPRGQPALAEQAHSTQYSKYISFPVHRVTLHRLILFLT
jgi:hypothetical protein